MKSDTPQLEDAIILATEAHKGQKEKSGRPYILHPLTLMMQMDTEAERMAAILHDVVEDTSCTLQDLQEKGYPQEVIDAVDCLTKRDGEEYGPYIERLRGNRIARKVKIADLVHNMDIRRLENLSDKDLQRLRKYHPIWKMLTRENL